MHSDESIDRAASPSARVPLQFKLAPEFVHAFKVEAATRDMKLNELLKACFTAFINHNPSQSEKEAA